MIHFVVARYNENLDWLQHLTSHAIIFNKGQKLANTIELPNVGREAHTYLNYICMNYSNLPEIVVFTQGYIDDHIPNGQNPTAYLERLAKEARVLGISNNFTNTCISPAFNIHQQEELRTKYKVQDPCTQIFGDWFLANFNKPFPADNCNICYGAVFAMRRDKILSRSRDFYNKLLHQLEYSTAPIEAHFLERSWFYIPNDQFTDIRFYGICMKDNIERVCKINDIKHVLPGLEIVDAIDARKFTNEYIESLKNADFFAKKNDKYIDYFNRPYQIGALGCFLSHKKVMNMVKDQNEKYAVVFEDDVRLLPEFHEKMYKILEMLKEYESKYGAIHICNLYVHPKQRNKLTPQILLAPPGFIGTQCFIIRKSTVQRVLDSLQQYGNPIDEQLSRDLNLHYVYIPNMDLIISDEIPSVIQDPYLKYLTIQ